MVSAYSPDKGMHAHCACVRHKKELMHVSPHSKFTWVPHYHTKAKRVHVELCFCHAMSADVIPCLFHIPHVLRPKFPFGFLSSKQCFISHCPPPGALQHSLTDSVALPPSYVCHWPDLLSTLALQCLLGFSQGNYYLSQLVGSAVTDLKGTGGTTFIQYLPEDLPEWHCNILMDGLFQNSWVFLPFFFFASKWK